MLNQFNSPGFQKGSRAGSKERKKNGSGNSFGHQNSTINSSGAVGASGGKTRNKGAMMRQSSANARLDAGVTGVGMGQWD